MVTHRACWGVDVGQCALKAVKMRQAGDRVEVLAFDIVDHPQILSEPDADAPALIRQALEKFLSRNDLTGAQVAVSVPGHQTFSRFTKLPPVEPKKIPDIVRFEARQQIPFDIDEVDWDYQTFQSADSPDVEVGIFAMKRDLIRSHLASLTAARIEPTIVQTAPLALYNFVRYDGLAKTGGTVLIDIGADNTDLIVTDGESVWTRNIPLGGNNFTEALVKAFKLSFAKAENLKRTAATSKYARQIFQAMRPVFADLVAEIQRSIGFYTSTHRDAAVSKVVGMGNAFRLPGLQKYLQQNLQLDVERVSAFSKVTFAPGANAGQFNEHVLSFGVAYGLALQGLGMGHVNSNLLPVELGRAAVWRHKRPLFAAAAACLVAAAGVLWTRGMMDRSALARNLGEGSGSRAQMSLSESYRVVDSGVPDDLAPRDYGDRIRAAADKLKQEYGRLNGQIPTKLKKIQDITSLVDKATLWFKILSVVDASLPAPQIELAAAKGPDEYRVAAKKIPRKQRKQIFIESFDAAYSPSVYDQITRRSSSVSFGSPAVEKGLAGKLGPVGAEPSGPVKSGFVVTMTVSTPNSEGISYVTHTLAANLGRVGRQPGLGFYIDEVNIYDSKKRAQADSRDGSSAGRSARTSKYGSRAGGGFDDNAAKMGRGPTGARTGSASAKRLLFGRTLAESGPQMPDPVTGEEMAEDCVCLMRFAVVLGEPEQTASPEGGGSATPPSRR
ncbi:MAG TPA: type IV pilus assembly protein PilM [Phycisphaerae bacterium]|nr:type IV pilus assembly protein PilM [Phycisphaerae bacterium]